MNVCSIDGCEKPMKARGWCGAHYALWRSNGVPERQRKQNVECKAADCSRAPRSRTGDWCEMHYYRLRRNGTLDTVQKRVPDAECIVVGCTNKAFHVEGTCRTCRLRHRQHGDYLYRNEGPLHKWWLNDDEVTSQAIHQRVRRACGPATEHMCVDCGRRAAHWSYNHQDPNERNAHRNGHTFPFGTSIDFYEPRCISCHKKFDLAYIRRTRGGAA